MTAGRGVPRNINGETIRFPARWSRYYPDDYEAETVAFLRAQLRPGDTALDIGAHLGLFSVLMARWVGPQGRVFSFEPTPSTRAILRRTLRLNHCDDRVEVHAAAVADCTGFASFFDTGDPVSNANSLIATSRHRRTMTIPTLSVDDFVAAGTRRIHLMKIDAEGAELAILRGARRTLAEQRPCLSLALHPAALRASGGSLAEVWTLLDEHRFVVHHERQRVEAAWFCQQQELFDVHVTPPAGQEATR